MMKDKLTRIFRERFSDEPLIVRSPGRVNIIGEHTDYNEGFVLPAAIDKAVYSAISKRNDDRICLYASNFNESVEIGIGDMKPVKHWSTYILGVVDQLLKRGRHLSGFNMLVDGNVPVGAGLSSSAALECSVTFALNETFSLNLSKKEMVDVAQMAEHNYAGVKCGVMDMFASVFGKKDHVIKLDCRSLEYEYVPLQLDGYSLVLYNTNIKHSLSSSEYNVRRHQCEEGVAILHQYYSSVNSLRDANMEMLIKYVKPKDELIFRRCSYVVSEIERLQAACDDLKNGDIKALGQKMFLTHKGLSEDYEVSCPELDILVNTVKNDDAVLGARMMGGGFGGCTINIVKEEEVEKLTARLSSIYKKETGIDMDHIVVDTSDGTSLL